jgi:tetratricopeptide (TPR) repeat protein
MIGGMNRYIPISIIVLGLAALYPLQRWIDSTTPRETLGDETLFLTSGETIKKMSPGLSGLAADIYWIRTVQYFGRKLLDNNNAASTGGTRDLRMELLAPLLNIVVTLDPHHIPAYHFGAIFLPERDLRAAIELLERGVQNNPGEWKFYQDLAYIHWQSGDYEKASEWYERGSQLPGAAWWMRDMAGVMKIKGGSRETARAIYGNYLESDDPHIRSQAIDRLKQLRALDEMEAINRLLNQLKQQTGSCPQSLRAIAPRLRAMGLRLGSEMVPIDPDDFAYELDAASCTVKLARDSTIPRL